MTLKSKTYSGFKIYFLFAIISVIFLFFASYTTSPLTKGYVEWDSVIFMLLGRFWKEGLTPYTDFFDHKGPVMFFIEYIGVNLLPDERSGVFLLQAINLTFVQIIIFRTAQLVLSFAESMATVLLSLLVLSLTIQGGNLTEEYSLAFLMLALYFTLKYCTSEKPRISFLQMFWVGISAAFLFWMRPTNMGIICSCCLFLLIMSVNSKKWKDLQNLISGTICGFITLSVIIIGYYLNAGTFNEMIYATFTFNLKYALNPDGIKITDGNMAYYIKIWLSVTVLAIGTIVNFFQTKDKRGLLLAGLMFGINVFSTICVGPGFHHYVTLNIPCFVLGCIFLIKATDHIRYRNMILWTGIIFLTVASFIALGYKAHNLKKDSVHWEYVDQVRDISANIPDSDIRQVYGYNVHSKFWYYSGFLPYFKYFMLQERHGLIDNEILQQINDKMKSESPMWVVIQPEASDKKVVNPVFYEILSKKYHLYAKNRAFELYKLNP